MSQALLLQPYPAPGHGLGACGPLNWGEGGWDWTLVRKVFVGRPHLACLCFPFCSGKYINFLGKGIRSERDKICNFYLGTIFSRGPAQFVFCRSSLSPQIPQLCADVCDPPSLAQIHTLHSWLPAPPTTAWSLRRLLRDLDIRTVGLRAQSGHWTAWKPLQLPDPPPQFWISRAREERLPYRPLLCHWARAEIPLAEKAEFQ